MTWSRRALLGAGAAAIALPWLESVTGRGARASADAPGRFIGWFCPNGVNMAAWRPTGEGPAWSLSPTLAPLEPWRRWLTVVSGLQNVGAVARQVGDHPRGAASFLSGAEVLPDTIRAGTTADQVVAAWNAGQTPFASLQVGVADGRATCDPGYSCLYNETVSWADDRTPLPTQTHPGALFDRLWGGQRAQRSPEEAARHSRIERSVLDALTADASALSPRLASADRPRLDAYLTGIRELELRLEAPEVRACEVPARPEAPVDPTAATEVMVSLMVLALRCDLTRSLTFMQGIAASPRDLSFLGILGQHHELSHHLGDPDRLRDIAVVDRWEMERLASFVRQLAEAEEGDGSLLDACAVVVSSDVSDGNRHNHDDMPVLVLGGGNGRLFGDQHLVASGASTAAMLLGAAQASGVRATSFGVADAPLPGLLRT